ncbi:metalloproteinase inhibitor 2-like [Entelurus aequoreus]|uniref:metalloproteinase inhibitor 2-like n=1 Tax=Entelurus aequoreus TaxID=161455 RepID=UPI002B1DDDE4|nr:metalloproteinase inhibitor 2-like [Entelurus aequoreus]
MMSWMKCCVFPLLLLGMWQLQEGAHACSCPQTHPQTAFCQSDVVIKAKVVAITAGEFGINYNIEQTKILKGPIRSYDTISTEASSAECGLDLTKGVEYFITGGRLKPDGSLHVILCDYVVLWKNSHDILVERYRIGCNCTITHRIAVPSRASPNECLWTDLLTGNLGNDEQCACIKKSDGSCAWYQEDASKELHEH